MLVLGSVISPLKRPYIFFWGVGLGGGGGFFPDINVENFCEELWVQGGKKIQAVILKSSISPG